MFCNPRRGTKINMARAVFLQFQGKFRLNNDEFIPERLNKSNHLVYPSLIKSQYQKNSFASACNMMSLCKCFLEYQSLTLKNADLTKPITIKPGHLKTTYETKRTI